MYFNQCNLLNIIFDQVVWLVPFGTARLVDFIKFAPKNTIYLHYKSKALGTIVAERYRSFVCNQHYKKSDVSLNVQEHKIWLFTAFPPPFR